MTAEQAQRLIERLEGVWGGLEPRSRRLYVEKLLPSWYEWGHRGVEAVIESHKSPKWPTPAEILEAIRAAARDGSINAPLAQVTSNDPRVRERQKEALRGVLRQDELLAMADEDYMRWLHETYGPARGLV